MRLGMGLGLGNLLSGQPLTGFPNDFSFNFDGNNDYLKFEDEFVFSGAFTVSLWVKHNSSGDEYTLGKQAGDQDAFILHPSASRWKIANVTSQSNTSIVANQWHHILAVRDSSNLFKWYVNGSSATFYDGSSYVTTGVTRSGDFDIDQIGRIGSTLYGEVQVDEVAFWDTALSASDVAKIASKPVDFSKASTYATDRTANLKLWLRAGDKALPEEDASIARQDFYTDFDGSNDYIDCGSDSSVDDIWTGGGTLTGWINVNSVGEGANGMPVVKRGSDSGWYIATIGASGNTCQFGLVVRWDNWAFWRTTSTDIIFNEWIHIAVSYDNSSTSNNPTIYINGVSVAVTEVTSPSGTYESDASDNLNIGGEAGSFTTDGAISSIALHQTVLDAQTISQMAKSRFTPMRDNRFSVVDFDGTDDRIDCGQIDVSGQSITLSAWFFRDGTTDDTIAGRWNGNGCMLYAGSTSCNFYVNGGVSFTSIPDKTWVHIVGTFDGVNRKIYKNGVLEDTDADTSTIVNPSENFEIGNAEFSSGKAFNGSISSVSLYNTAKSAEEVYAIYQQGITYDESSLSGLVGYWRMGDDTSKAYPTIADSSSNSNDGTITNGASDDIVQQMVAGYDLGAFESSSEELGGDIYGRTNSGLFTAGSGAGQWSGGTVTSSSVAGGATLNGADPTLSTSVIYRVQFTCTVTSGSFDIRVGSTSTGTNSTGFISSSGSYEFSIIAGGSNHDVAIIESSWSGSITSFSIKEVLQSEDLSDTHPAIIDVTEPVLGEQLWDSDASTFDSGTHSWIAFGNNTIENDNGALKITYVDNGNGAYNLFRDAKDLSSNLTVGKTYKLKFDAKVNTGSVTSKATSASSTHPITTEVTISETTFTEKIIYFNASSATDNYMYFNNSMGTGQIVFIDNLSLKEVQGNVGTMTNQDSADLVYSSVLPDQSFLTGVNSAYNFVSLDGTNDYIKNESYTAHQQDTGTISIWVKFDHVSGRQLIVGAGGTSGTGTNRAIGLADDDVKFFGAAADGVIGANVVADNWYHIVLTWNGTSVVVYVDGISYSQTQSALVTPTGTKFVIGSASWDFSSKTDGDFGTVAHWNKILTSTEVNAIKDLGRHGNLLDSYSDNLKLYYSMSGLDAKTGFSDTATTIYDRSGNSNHGTPVSIASSDLKSSPNAQPEGYAKQDVNRSTTTP